jgi:hypothetical protein
MARRPNVELKPGSWFHGCQSPKFSATEFVTFSRTGGGGQILILPFAIKRKTAIHTFWGTSNRRNFTEKTHYLLWQNIAKYTIPTKKSSWDLEKTLKIRLKTTCFLRLNGLYLPDKFDESQVK